MTDFQSNFEKSLKALDLQAIVLVQGLLAQRALEILTEKPKIEKIDVVRSLSDS